VRFGRIGVGVLVRKGAERLKPSQLILAARIYFMLSRLEEPLTVDHINDRLVKHNCPNRWGMTKNEVKSLLCLMRARGLVRRIDGGWKIARRVGNISQFVSRIGNLPPSSPQRFISKLYL